MRQVRSFMLPFTVLILVPFLILFNFKTGQFQIHFYFPLVQIILGFILFLTGIILLVITIRMVIRIGKGTLAPWDPTKKLVAQGIYAHTRNPMISGLLFALLGESVFFGSMGLFIWFVAALLVNTVYFKLSEEPGLVKRFGKKYIEYRRNVPMWLPRLKPWKK